MYAEAVINIILNGGKVQKVSSKSVTKQGCLLVPLLFYIALKTQVRAIKQEK